MDSPGRRSQRVVALAYHAIAEVGDDPVLARWSVAPELFDRQLDALARSGWSFVDLDFVLGVLAGERSPGRSILLTFDDAYTDLLEAALPALRRHRAPAMVFAVAGQIGGSNVWDQPAGARAMPLLDADGLRAAAGAGIEVGSHATTHRPMRSVPDAELEDELAGSAERLTAIGLARPRAFAYPFGDNERRVADGIAAAEYAAAFTITAGTIDSSADPFLLPRVAVLGHDSPRDLRVKIATAAWKGRLRKQAQRLLGVKP